MANLAGNVQFLNPSPTVQLLEGSGLNVEYVPIEAGLAWKDIVLPADHNMIEAIVVATVARARTLDIAGAPTPSEDDEDEQQLADAPTPQERDVTTSRTNYQITKNVAARRYNVVFEFPRGTHFPLVNVNQIYAMFPNFIIQEESQPFVTPNGLLGWRWVVSMDAKMYSRADVIFLHAEPRNQVTHVFPERVGRNNEGRGMKRQRDPVPDEQLVGRKNK